MLRRSSFLLFLLVPLVAWGGVYDHDSAPPVEPPPEFIDAGVRLTDAGTAALVEGATVTFEDQEELTDTDGRAELTIPSQVPFELLVSPGADYQDYALAGLAGVDSFLFQTLVSSRAVTDAVYGALGLVADPTRGVLVVSLDTVALQAAIGGRATIDVDHDEPFIFVGNPAAPQAGDELIFDSQAFISFPNVAPGEVTVSITPPDGDACLSFPALDAPTDLRTFTVEADRVTVATFICQ